MGKVSSNFYREFLKDSDFDVEAEQFDIEEFQKTMLLAANKFSRKPVSELEHLAEIQHYGGKPTSLISRQIFSLHSSWHLKNPVADVAGLFSKKLN